MQVALKETWLGLRNSTTRIPFRYGKACLTSCPQAILAVKIEVSGKTLQAGYAGDCLPPSWFDKSPHKDYQQQINDMLSVIGVAQSVFGTAFAQPLDFFPGWLASYEQVHAYGRQQGLPPLLSSFGVSLVERAMMDAMARAAGINFHQAVTENIYSIAPGEVHDWLQTLSPAAWLPERPLDSIWVRHTVGLADPLTIADIPLEERLQDGYPQAFEEYVEQTGTKYFKIKVSNDVDQDLERLKSIARIAEHHRGRDYRVTLDGNEQYQSGDEFMELVEAMLATQDLTDLCDNILCVEQPLTRDVALSTDAWREFDRWPVIIDESDGDLDSYAAAISAGYHGVSSKNCKGPIKSILNAGLTWLKNRENDGQRYIMTGEDLCSVGVVPVQADLALAATIGLTHVERNGHHYHPGLNYLPAAQQKAALDKHGDFYAEQGGVIRPNVRDGRFHMKSLQCPGFGFAVEPELTGYIDAELWQFESLGID